MYFLSDYKTNDQRVKASYKSLDGVPVNGFVVTSVPPQVPVDTSEALDNPPALRRGDVLRQKYEGILDQTPFFSEVHYESLEDPTIIDTLENAASGNYKHWIGPQGNLTTMDITLDSPASEYMIHWDVYTLTREHDDQRNFVYYQQEDASELKVSLAQINENQTESMGFTTITQFQGGDNLVRLTFENLSGDPDDRLYLGGFAIFY